MKPENVYTAVAKIKDLALDDEAAHAAEDELYAAVLRAIASGKCVDAAECARIALTTQRIGFQRWCA